VETNNLKKYLIITLAVIVGLLVANSVIFTPLWNAWTSRQEKIKKLTEEIQTEKKLAGQRGRDIKERWANIQSNALPSDLSQAQSTVVKAVDRWAQISGVTTESVSPQVRTDPDESNRDVMITTVECRVDATGTMNSLLSFLYAIGREKMGTKLDNVEIGMKDAATQQMTIGLTISALVLGVPPPPSTSAPAPATAND